MQVVCGEPNGKQGKNCGGVWDWKLPNSESWRDKHTQLQAPPASLVFINQSVGLCTDGGTT